MTLISNIIEMFIIATYFFAGGSTGRRPSGNGEGGYSYISQRLTDIYFKAAAHYGPGEIFIIPAISGCSCDYRCVVLDQYLSETKCLCPQGWLLSNDSKSCGKYDIIIIVAACSFQSLRFILISPLCIPLMSSYKGLTILFYFIEKFSG